MTAYNYIDLFHGIGGFALGAYWAGMKFKNQNRGGHIMKELYEALQNIRATLIIQKKRGNENAEFLLRRLAG